MSRRKFLSKLFNYWTGQNNCEKEAGGGRGGETFSLASNFGLTFEMLQEEVQVTFSCASTSVVR